MARTLLASLAIAAAAVSATAFADPPQTPAPATPEHHPVVVGGYAPATEVTPEIAQARAFAATAVMKDLPAPAKVTKVSQEQQVVAGINYRIHFELSNGDKWDVVVYHDLQGKMSLTSKKKMN